MTRNQWLVINCCLDRSKIINTCKCLHNLNLEFSMTRDSSYQKIKKCGEVTKVVSEVRNSESQSHSWPDNVEKDLQSKTCHCNWPYRSPFQLLWHWPRPAPGRGARNVKHTPPPADYKQYLALRLRGCHTNVRGKLCHMPKALVSINTAPVGVGVRVGETNLGCQAATIAKKLSQLWEERGREMKRSEKNEFGAVVVRRLPPTFLAQMRSWAAAAGRLTNGKK